MGRGRPAPAGWPAGSVEEHAHDAGLLAALGLAPAAVVGNSLGALIALALAVHHPEAVRVPVLDEPPMISEISSLEQVVATVGPMFEAGVRSGGSPEAVERFCDFVSARAFAYFDPALGS